MKQKYSNQKLYSDLSYLFLLVEQITFGDLFPFKYKTDNESIFNLILQSEFCKNHNRVEQIFIRSSKSLITAIENTDSEKPTRKDIIKLKTKLIELKFIVQSEIEKETQQNLFGDVA